ncbi:MULTISPECIES: UDP-glucose 4-epimerase GalE [Pseudomonas]|uniref:UDP-glucose 4-epimerase GalE n=1 Tax=Pseudomonas TaxID=286 RepID=UPI000F582969|nr:MULTISPECIES: UDP-glucose 4-epimerase GalE [Pseudomonas]AZF15485.1 UDP-glucose 4-epimerase [Pseudomonas sp. R3-18-08]AZF20796.1 UDP-glucose 4-epimerase [Pseudomonas sp. R3-52-08]AZF26126.1 UDP-glucose 4-epimerase [Pseudomonas sp. R2-60-08W]AZF31491.1 UDP-glucose 4-epimerase [Pseudomonas sp. R4-35-07]AZF36769.1 UDP-glucose 4-epimerase [Pseudomonas sp. R4-39-08]
MILITGGAGYIGAHVALELMVRGEEVLILDNLCNSRRSTIDRVSALAGKRPEFIYGDVRNRRLLDRLLRDYPIDAVVHCAGLKAVGESVREPLRYYDTNVGGSVVLCQAMAKAGVFRLVFSSSATVYGDCTRMPINEACATGQPTNPYGMSKLMCENVMKSVASSDPRWSIGLLRYFNPIGAHASGLLGEAPTSTPNNLLPYLLQVASGERQALSVYGKDYPTPDGTGVRDYIHVVDLALGHISALEALRERCGVSIWNLGTGRGYSVLDVINAFEKVSGVRIPLNFEARRPGDIACCWADPQKSIDELGWQARFSLEQMLYDAWRWQINQREHKAIWQTK